jgi:hypothetical protein
VSNVIGHAPPVVSPSFASATWSGLTFEYFRGKRPAQDLFQFLTKHVLFAGIEGGQQDVACLC